MIRQLAPFLPAAVLYGAASVSGLWAYAMYRGHDGDQYRFARYSYVLFQAASVAGGAALIATVR